MTQLIKRAEDELKKTPNSVQIHQTLADYYTAARQSDKARAELAKLAELRPDDTGLRLQVANQLARAARSPGPGPLQDRVQERPGTSGRSFRQIESMLLQAGTGRRTDSAARGNRSAPIGTALTSVD